MLKQVGEYDVKEKLGEGTFGLVRKVVQRETKKEFAMKMLDKEKMMKEDLAKGLKNEVKLMKLIKHPNVVNLHEVLSSKSKFFLVLELIDGGDLFDYLLKKDYLGEDEARNIFQQIICGIEFCHIRGVSHRDLKPENILITESGLVKISDFGLSSFVEPSSNLDLTL